MQQKRPLGYKAERRKALKDHKQRKKRIKAATGHLIKSDEFAHRIHGIKMDLIELEPWYIKFFSIQTILIIFAII